MQICIDDDHPNLNVFAFFQNFSVTWDVVLNMI